MLIDDIVLDRGRFHLARTLFALLFAKLLEIPIKRGQIYKRAEPARSRNLKFGGEQDSQINQPKRMSLAERTIFDPSPTDLPRRMERTALRCFACHDDTNSTPRQA